MIELMTRTSNSNLAGARALQPNEKWWHAVQTRDRSADGAFVYAVRSTGIYCRPSCASRKPRREQVQFFSLPEAAEQNGFRACLRCRPRLARLRDPRAAAVAKVCREIEAQIDADGSKSAIGDASEARLTLGALSSAVGMSAHQLERAFRSVMGISPRQYADARRMRRLKSRLKKGDDVTTALYDAGFGSSSRLYERAPAQLGMTPATYRQGGAGMKIHYTIVSFAARASARSSNQPRHQRAVSGQRRCATGRVLAQGISTRRNSTRQKWPGRLGEQNSGALARAGAESRSAHRRASHRVSTASVGRIAKNSVRRHAHVQPGRARDWQTKSDSSRGASVRYKSGFRGGAVPSRGA